MRDWRLMMGKLRIRRSKKHLDKNSQKLKDLKLDEETPDYIVITEVVDSSEHKQDSNQVVDGVAQTLNPDLLNEILAQTSEVGEYQIYVKNDDELLISGPVPTQTANEDVNYPTLESSDQIRRAST